MPTLPRDHSAVHQRLAEIYRAHKNNSAGQVATYIPELAKADPNAFGIAVATSDGMVYEIGDSRVPFTIQSISKPFVYGLALADSGTEHVLNRVGVEPSGEAFNSIVFDERGNRPFNPMVNAGAIATTALVKGDGHAHRLKRILDLFAGFAGEPLTIDQSVYRSEKSTGHRNRAITYLELNFGMIDEPVEDHLDLYFNQCSILVTARHLALMAATLANNGVNPTTGQRALPPQHVRSLLSIMSSCGMYDFSGEWIYRVGLPAKSGVAGGIIAVLPGQFGIGVFSPPLDSQGNSVRGIGVCEDISREFNLHVFDKQLPVSVTLRRAYRGSDVRSKRIRRPEERAVLAERGQAIHVMELQGNLSFASMERVFRQLSGSLEDVRYIILDGRRVSSVDFSARSLLVAERVSMQRLGLTMLLAGFPQALSDELLAGGADWPSIDILDSVDEALERCEGDLISSSMAGTDRQLIPVPLSDMEITHGFDASEVKVLQGITRETTYTTGDVIIREGDHAGELFMLAAGSATISVRLGADGRRRRLGSLGEGVTFGEIALFEGGPRTADVIADGPVTCYALSVADLNDIAPSHPALQLKLLRNVGQALARRLRQANAEIRALE